MLLIIFTKIGLVFLRMERGKFYPLIEPLFSPSIRITTAFILQAQNKKVDCQQGEIYFFIFTVPKKEILKTMSYMLFIKKDYRWFTSTTTHTKVQS